MSSKRILSERIMANPLPLLVIIAWLMLTFATVKVSATEVENDLQFEYGLGYSQLDVGWLNDSEFKPQMLNIEGTVWLYKNIGIRGQYGYSDKAHSEELTQYGAIEYQIQDMTTVQLMYKYTLPLELRLELGIGYASYDDCYTNALGYSDYCGNDNDIMYSVGLMWKNFRLGYADYYEKDKGLKGKETMSGVSLTYIFKF